MNPLAALLSDLSAAGFRMELRGCRIALMPKDRVTPEIRDEVFRYRPDLVELLQLHGTDLLALFRDAPTWPAARGCSGLTRVDWFRLIQSLVGLHDGRIGTLWGVTYNTRSGRLRLIATLPDGSRLLLDPEDVAALIPDAAAAVAVGTVGGSA